MLIVLAVGLLTLTPSARADDAGAGTFSEWLVMGAATGSAVTVSHAGETSLGTIGGWRCIAALSADGDASHRRDKLSVECSKGDVMVRTQATHTEGAAREGVTPFQVVVAGKPIRTILFGPK